MQERHYQGTLCRELLQYVGNNHITRIEFTDIDCLDETLENIFTALAKAKAIHTIALPETLYSQLKNRWDNLQAERSDLKIMRFADSLTPPIHKIIIAEVPTHHDVTAPIYAQAAGMEPSPKRFKQARHPGVESVYTDRSHLTIYTDHQIVEYTVYERLTGWPDEFFLYLNLRKLSLFNSSVNQLPEAILQLTQLQELRIERNALHTLPQNIGWLVHLVELNVASNQLQELPESIGELGNLKSLYIANNKLQMLPKSIGKLDKLKVFDISNNKLQELPECIGALGNLTTLSIYCNKLQKLPESLGRLTNLSGLFLSENNVQVLPECFGMLSKLGVLDISDNALQMLPESFGRLSNLTQLLISGNKLKKLPESFGMLANLKMLIIADNKLKVLRQRSTFLKKLTHFNLSNNELKTLPSNISDLNDECKLIISKQEQVVFSTISPCFHLLLINTHYLDLRTLNTLLLHAALIIQRYRQILIRYHELRRTGLVPDLSRQDLRDVSQSHIFQYALHFIQSLTCFTLANNRPLPFLWKLLIYLQNRFVNDCAEENAAATPYQLAFKQSFDGEHDRKILARACRFFQKVNDTIEIPENQDAAKIACIT